MADSLIDSTLTSVILLGDYGSGKTEVAVNLALRLVGACRDPDPDGRPVAIADLDLVNPYFRCREAQEPLQDAGIRVVVPGGGHQYADLPILLPQVKGLLADAETLSVLDVGGDEAGSRVLSALAGAFDAARHGCWFVVNENRPFCDTPRGIMDTIDGIEHSAGVRVTGLVSNTHLMEETTPAMVHSGLRISREVGRLRGLPVRFVAAMAQLAGQLDLAELGVPLLTMERIMTPPWVRRAGAPKMGPELMRGL